jgi:hypothetical protein
MMNKTTERLIVALHEEHAPEWIIVKATNMQYDDYLSDSAFNIADLVSDCRKAGGLQKIINRAIDGQFDASEDESDAWAASPEGQATFQELLGDHHFKTKD